VSKERGGGKERYGKRNEDHRGRGRQKEEERLEKAQKRER
jgi:hypothetical protein